MEKNKQTTMFPRVIIPCNSPHDFLENLEIKEALEQLEKRGAILIRGFAINSASDFNDFMKGINWELFPYSGFDSRSHLLERVWTTNEGPLDREIFFHHEMSYSKEFPSKLAFFCKEAPPKGEGQTSLLKSQIVLERMKEIFPDFIKEVEEKGVVYHCLRPNAHNVLPHLSSISWQAYFNTDDPVLAQRRAEEKWQYIEWKEDGSAEVISKRMEGIRDFGGTRVWFNTIPSYFVNSRKTNECKRWVTLGDGGTVGEEVIETMVIVMNEESVDVEWEKGDVVLIDNLRVMHARRPCLSCFSPRKILLSMAK